MSYKEKTVAFLQTIIYGFGKRDANGKRIYSMLQLALFIFISSGIVFMVTAAISYHTTREKALKDATALMQLNMDLATEIIDNHVKQAESSGFSLTSLFFNKEMFVNDGDTIFRFVYEGDKAKPSIAEIYRILDKFTKSNHSVTGAAIGFEPGIYPEYGEVSVAPFVRQSPDNDTVYEWLDLPDMNSVYREKDWYKTTKEVGVPRWSPPYLDVKGAVITTFCIPVYKKNGDYIGTVAMDMNLEVFSKRLRSEINPYNGSELMLIGPKNMFLVHPDQSCVMNCSIESIESLRRETEDKNATLFYHRMDSDEMIVAVSCPNNAIYAEIDELLRRLMKYAGRGLLLVEICCLLTFFQLKRLVESKASIENELNIAANVQRSMLPMMFPAFPDRKDLDLCAKLVPAKSIGGDLYDYVIRKNDAGHDTLLFAIGDVSGKGISASLLMVVVCALFRDMAMKTTDPMLVASDINDCISERNEYNMFCTMFVGSLDLVTRELRYCNAGHNQPVIIKKGKASFINVIPNIPLGTFGGFEYQSESLVMDKEDILYIYTDGVTEAENMFKKMYSDERLLELLDGTVESKASDLIDKVFNSVNSFVGKADQSDDITMLAIKLNDIKH
ncbi:MAG: SpoIIE family protein phosphatase [Paludibacteraceae bacterium]|nr:SpoIIE family protein phosphatase [Paludibacteraceae bacterium]